MRVLPFLLIFIWVLKPEGNSFPAIEGNFVDDSLLIENSYKPEDKPAFQILPPNFKYNGIQCILKDYKGYMWFGTMNGLVKYDGINTYLYEHISDDTTSLSHNSVNALLEDGEKLWVATSRGLNLYRRGKDNFIRIGTQNNQLQRLRNTYISDLCLDQNSKIWITTFGGGVNIYDSQNQTLKHFSYNPSEANSLSSNRITSVIQDKDDAVWLGTQNGLIMFVDSLQGFKHFYSNKGGVNSLCNNNITELEVDLEGNIWIGTRGGGLDKLIKNKQKYIFKNYSNTPHKGSLSNNYILSLCADKNGYLWVGTENGGLNKFDKKKNVFKEFRVEEGNGNSILSNSIWSLYNDDEGRLWVGTLNKGVNVLDNQYNKFETYQKNIVRNNTLPNNDVTGFTEDSKGNIWISTDGGGICKFDPLSRKVVQIIDSRASKGGLTKNAVKAIVCDSEDNIWVGMWAGGVDCFNKNGKKIKNYKLERKFGGGDNNVISLYFDSKGSLWAGTNGSGLFKYNSVKDRFMEVIGDSVSSFVTNSAYITTIFEDSKGVFWVGSLNGVAKMKYNDRGDCSFQDIQITNQEGVSTNYSIFDIYEDSKNRLWFGTENNGLLLFDRSTNSAIIYSKKQGLPGNLIQGVLEDNEGQLWITTNNGVSKFNTESVVFTNYTVEDGLNSNEFITNSILRSQSGEFYMGGENGFNVFFPQNIRSNSNIPPVYLTRLKINNIPAVIGAKDSPLEKHIGEVKAITLNYKQSSFTIEFVALNYTRPTRNQYAYILDGFEDKWTNIGTNRSATYTNIRPGKYIFRVKGSNNDGIWNNRPTELFITIQPPIWKTWWAIVIYVVLLSVIVRIILKEWNDRIKIKNQLKFEQLAREKEHELNESNLKFFTNISHEFRTPLSLIIAPLESLLESSPRIIKEQLLVIYRNAGRLLDLTNTLMDIRKLETGNTKLRIQSGNIIDFIHKIASYFIVKTQQHKIDFTIDSDFSDVKGWYDPDKLETIVMNLFSNAFKYTKDRGSIRIVIRTIEPENLINYFDTNNSTICFESRYLEMNIFNNGEGIPEAELNLIFEKFYRAKSSEHKKVEGTGVGLALVKGLVDLMHGDIRVNSIPGKETCFTMRIPIDQISFRDEEINDNPLETLSKTYYSEFDIIPAKDVVPRKDEVDTNKYEVLLVEDNSELRNFLSKELKKNYKVMTAKDGKEGVEQALKNIPDLIVSDILMPELVGTELCKIVKSDSKTCHIPVILLTAKTAIYEQIAGIETGSDVYLTKPFNVQLLLAHIKQLIQIRNQLFARFSQDVYLLPKKLTDNAMDQDFIQRVIEYVVKNIAHSELGVESLAEDLNLSRSHVYRKIKALTGNTVVEFIRMIRLKEAIKLMEMKKYSLAEIAYRTGFTSPSYFTKSFKECYGKPPSEYQK